MSWRPTGWRIGRGGARGIALIIALIMALFGPSQLSGCVPEPQPGFNSPAPNKRLDAIVNASRLENEESLVKLVKKLRSADPAERMFAIRSLEIRTDQTLGYDHAAEHWERIEAYRRWLDYLEQRGIDTEGIRDDGSGVEEGQLDQPMEEDAG